MCILSRFISFALFFAALVGCMGCGSSATDVPGTIPSADGAGPGGDGAIDGTSDSNPLDSVMPDSVTADSSSPSVDARSPMADAASDGAADSASPGEAGSSMCTVASDCRAFSNYCGTCACEALGASQPAPRCDAGTVSCLIDPCEGQAAVCDRTGHCALQ